MQSNYWNRIGVRRIGRRRAIALTGAALTGSAILAACGGNEGSGGDASSGLISKPIDTTAQAKKGGVFKSSWAADTSGWDPSQSGVEFRGHLHSTLLMAKSAPFNAPLGEYQGDIAESWEISPDKLTMTFKLRSNAHFAPLPPTNGRVVTIEDVKASFDYYEKVGNRRADLYNTVSAGAPLVSVTVADSRTLVLKLKSPDVVIMGLLAGSTYPTILAKEGVAGDFDLRATPRGSGAYYLKEYLPSARYVLEKNPAYHLPGPNIPTWELPIVTEYATFLAQFRAGNIWNWEGSEVRGEDVLPTKREKPEINLFLQGMLANQGQQFFGIKEGSLSPFRDERVRQALSMSYDRDLSIDTFFNVSTFERDGVALNTRWSLGGISANVEGRWLLDATNKTKGQELGENAKYFKLDVAEAKKLLSAAGYANGADAESHHITTTEFGRDHAKMIEVLTQMAQESGFRIKSVPALYATEFRNVYREGKGNFEGLSAVNTSMSSFDDPTGRFHSQYHSTGDLFKGFDADGKTPGKGDAMMDDLTTRMRQEFDLDKRIALAHELERQDAKKQYYLRFPGGAEGFAMAWPCLSNFGVYQGGPSTWQYWVDESKPPFRSS